MIDQILPTHTSKFTRTLENMGAKRMEKVAPYIDAIGMKWNSPQPRLMPHLIEETGLGMLSPYVDNVYELYEQGLQWLRVRGMPVAVYQGLGFIGYNGSLETTPRRRRKWHWEQLSLDALPASEDDLPRISGVVGLSVSARTHFSRGYNGYDFRAVELSQSKSGNAILSSHSGARVGDVPTKWSFGTTHEFQKVLTDAEKQEVGVFVDTSSGGVSWEELAAPWDEIQTPWADLGIGAKLRVMARQTAGLGGYMGFYRADGSLIGARRFKVLHQVAPGTTYKVGSEQIAPSDQGQRVYVEALTGFGDGADEECASCALLLGATPKPHLPRGKLWLLPDQIETPFAAVAEQALMTDLRLTKRTRVKVLLSFA
ncbi:hypothetical protein [Pseudovibrio brasiliensis]|uniref:Phage tail protein (Tail_P2_I) n=1 Tax=Pseudovibrio brasiliensis TaxID=1898042 RepID=A0ABX8AVZ1_9HYPH|nr:hypothetical protein [Pseudovibrio brasiliensis]QUS59208.1 hypothetical protein KGB56_26865 [Pseudovibrio brasiliensis]